jgi:UDP-N-acetylglucosamine 2-epimerase (non-hydrolysing)
MTSRTRKTVLCVFGTRPEAIKMAPVVLALRKAEGFQVRVCVTAQHRQMLDQVLALFGIRPDADLNVMRQNQSLTDITAQVLQKMEPVLKGDRPDLVLVHGDTTTSLAASLAAFYQRIPVGHVEAGLRTGDKYYPYPEEINRRLTDSLADYRFAPTPWARENLLLEGIPTERIWVTGNTVIDALLWTVRKTRRRSKASTPSALYYPPSAIRTGRRLILVTAHRRENFGRPLEEICLALRDLVKKFPDVEVLYPVHLNPNVREAVRKTLDGFGTSWVSGAPAVLKRFAGGPGRPKSGRIVLTEPLDYEPFVALMDASYLILTDSGGIQEEAPSLGKPVLVLRDETERPEAVEAGTVKLVGPHREKIVEEASRLLEDPREYRGMARSVNPYGDGKAAGRIVRALRDYL